MNKLFSIVILAFIIVSCNKDVPFSNFKWPYWGTTSSFKNGLPWFPKVIAVQDEKDTLMYGIHLDLYNDEDLLRSSLIIWGLKKGEVGKFRITSDSIPEIISCYYTTFLGDGDLIGDVFKLDKSKVNIVEITEIIGNEIFGKFIITMFRDSSIPKYLESMDTLKFTNDAFHTRIIKAR